MMLFRAARTPRWMIFPDIILGTPGRFGKLRGDQVVTAARLLTEHILHIHFMDMQRALFSYFYSVS